MAERVLPHNLEAEKSVLGAILIDNPSFNQAAEVIDAHDFFRDAHRRIFEKMIALSDRSQPIDLVTLKDELVRTGELDEVGGPAYVASLTDGVPRSANVEYYAKIVKERSTLRRLIQSANDVLARAYDAEEDADEDRDCERQRDGPGHEQRLDRANDLGQRRHLLGKPLEQPAAHEDRRGSAE